MVGFFRHVAMVVVALFLICLNQDPLERDPQFRRSRGIIRQAHPFMANHLGASG